MADWTGYANRLRVGMDWSITKNPSQGDPSVLVAVNAYAQTNYTYYDYDGTVTITGDFGSGQQTRRMSNSNVMTFHSWTAGFTARYNEAYNVRLNLRAEGTGAGPVDGSWWLTIPRRPTGNSTPPRNIRVQSLSWDTAEITWDSPSDYRGADWNRYEVALDNNPWQTSNNWRTHKFTGLKGGTTYKFWVRAVCQGWDAWRNGEAVTFNFTTPPGVPYTAAPPTVDQVTATSARITMVMPGTPELPILDTRAYIYDAAVGGNAVWTDGVADLAVQWTATGLPKATTLWADVGTRNAAGPSALSTRTKFTTLPTLPSAPKDYTVRDVTANTAYTTNVFVQDTGGEPPSGIRVQWNTTASETDATTRTLAVFEDVLIEGLTAGALCYYRVAVSNRAGWSAWGEWKNFRTSSVVPNRVDSLSADLALPNATFTWSAATPNSAEITGYQIQVSDEPRFSSPIIDTRVVSSPMDSGGFASGRQYYARVRAMSGAGPGAWSLTYLFPDSPVTGVRSWLRVSGVWRQGTLWIRAGGVWRKANPNVRVGGAWRTT